MINLIRSLFTQSKFEEKVTDFGSIFRALDKHKSDYWGLVSVDKLDSFVDKQGEIFRTSEMAFPEKDLAKNLSILLLLKTEDSHLTGSLNREILDIEENPFFFKKHVLYYSEEEAEQLEEILEKGNQLISLKSIINSPDTFLEYKKQSSKYSWQALCYRIAIKLPFLEITEPGGSDLETLDTKKAQELSRSRDEGLLVELDKALIELFKSDPSSFEAMSPKDLLASLSTKGKR